MPKLVMPLWNHAIWSYYSSCRHPHSSILHVDWLSLSWAINKFKTQPTRPASWVTTSLGWTETWFWAVLILDWLYLSFHWSECDQNLREDPRKVPDHIQIKIRMPNPSQEPPASSKTPNQDLKDMAVLCTFKIKIESQNLEYGCIKEQWPYTNQDQDAKPQSGTSNILQNP